MKPADKDKLNECLKILDTTDLGLSLVWLWTWSTINGIFEDETEEAMDSMERTEAQGRLDTLVELYKLTYDLSFAIGARNV